MLPENDIKQNQTPTPNKEERVLLNLDEMKAKELKYFNQLMEIQKCRNFIDDAHRQVDTLNEQQRVQDKWEHYISCNPLPKPYIPPDIRLFYSKEKYGEKENIDKNINLLLSVDERSILTQDIHHQDLTRRKLNATLWKNIGKEYNSYINNSLRILRRINDFLHNDSEVAKCSVSVLDDIVSRKSAIQHEIGDFMDRFTYRIICAENVEMNPIDSISAEYFFKALDFVIHIWCLKNVAIRISDLSEPRLLANFHSMKLLLHIPSNMLKENMVIRALHMNFDHFSENAKSFEKTVSVSGENLNAGILDIHKCLVNEWFMQMEIQARVRHDMMRKRALYEQQIKQYEENMAKKKVEEKNGKNLKKKRKMLKPIKEPILLANDMFPDVYEEFLQEEQQQYDDFCKSIYDPELLNFSYDEINLRKHFILGGVYQMYYIEKPIHNDFNSFSMTCHMNEAKLNIYKDIVISPESRPSKVSRRSTRRMTIFEMENKQVDPNLESPWFVITIELPQYLCFWGEPPIACHLEKTSKKIKKLQPAQMKGTDEISEINKTDVAAYTQSTGINPKTRIDSTAINANNSVVLPELYKSLYLQDPDSLKRKHSVVSQQIFLDSFYRPSLASCLLSGRKSELSRRVGLNYSCINDFPLTNILTKSQIRHMQRHIIPRIISSYKFPKEIQLEDLELLSAQPKRKGGRIIRHKQDNSPPPLSTGQFTFNDRQNNPERTYAKYPTVEHLEVLSYIKELDLDGNQKEPETFAQLLHIISEIKNKYRLRQQKVINVKPMHQEIKTQNKRIKQMLEKREQTSLISTSTTKHSTVKSIKFDSKLSKQSKNEIPVSENLSETKANSLGKNNNSLLVKDKSFIRNDTEEEYDTETYWHWTKKYILKSEFDRKNCKMVLHTDRLGNFGFAFKRYEHFPFKYWSMEPNKDDPENEIIFTLDTKHIRCVLYITADGIRGHVAALSEAYVRKSDMYLVIEEPIKDFKEFKKVFKERHLNIFAEHDARYYIENGYFSEKHLSNELHTYSCMAVHSTQMLYNSSLWNRLAKRRDIILQFKHYQDVAGNPVEVRITPGAAFFVEIQELCSEDLDLDVVKLDYNLTWRNIESYSDLHHLIVSMYPTATDLRCKNPKLLCYIRNLLSEIRPLSFS